MADPGLVQALDYILNHSDDASIEVIAEAVVRRRRNMHLFNAVNIPDAKKMADDLAEHINEGFGGGLDIMRQQIREMIVRIVKEHAPELTSQQIDELSNAWLPDANAGAKEQLPRDVLFSMIEQFIAFSHGTMNKSVDENLRNEMGAWPERYWNAFPPVVRQLTSDYLKNKITEKDFYTKLNIAIG